MARTTSLSCALVLLLGCKQAAPPPAAAPAPVVVEPAAPASLEARRWTWTARNGDAEISQTWLAEGKCRVDGRGSRGAWTLEACLGTNLELWFASPGGDRLIKLEPLPLGADDWELVPVVTLFDRGLKVGGTNARAMVGDVARVRPFGRRFGWLGGTAEIPGVSPHLDDPGTNVEGEAIGGRTFRFSFETWAGVPPAATQRSSKERPQEFALQAPRTPYAQPAPRGTGPPLQFAAQPLAPQRQRFNCTFRGKTKATPRKCMSDSDCGGDVCEGGSCIKGGTHRAFTVGEVGGEYWDGHYDANASDLETVSQDCSKYARSRSGEDIDCSCRPAP